MFNLESKSVTVCQTGAEKKTDNASYPKIFLTLEQ